MNARFFGTAQGRVQGVGFRFFVQSQAQDLGVTGWVKNMHDGSVTMELQGDENAIAEMEKRIKKGNYFIRVDSFSLEPRDLVPDEVGFHIRS